MRARPRARTGGRWGVSLACSCCRAHQFERVTPTTSRTGTWGSRHRSATTSLANTRSVSWVGRSLAVAPPSARPTGCVFLGECYFPGADGRRSEPCHPSPESRAAPFLFIPIAGPFLTFTNRDVRNDGGAVFWFSFFGCSASGRRDVARLRSRRTALRAQTRRRPSNGSELGAAPLLTRARVLGSRPGSGLARPILSSVLASAQGAAQRPNLSPLLLRFPTAGPRPR